MARPTREYEGGGYGFAVLDGAEIRLGLVHEADGHASAYLFVEDADELARVWQSAGASGRVRTLIITAALTGAVRQIVHDGSVDGA